MKHFVLENYSMNFPSFILNVGYHQSNEMKTQNWGASNKTSKPVIDVKLAKKLIVCNYNFLLVNDADECDYLFSTQWISNDLTDGAEY